MKLPFQLDRYTLVELIGVGAFGQVYRAEVRGDMGFVSDFAVKVLDANVVADNPNVARQMGDEARLLSQLDHPNIVKVVDFKHVDHRVLGSVYFMVMEFVRGTDVSTILNRILARGSTSPASAVLHMGLMVSDALAHAHSLTSRDGQPLKLVHRDLKPQNLMVNFRGQVKVLDFGIAKAQEDDRLASRTQEGQTKGTVFYMSPEQLAGDELDGRSDIYSLGTILFELLLGRRLLDVEVTNAAELVRAMHTAFELDTDERLDVLQEHLSAGRCGELSQEAVDGWLALLRSALQKDPRYRPDSSHAFSEQLEWLRSRHPPSEDRNFWVLQVEEAARARQTTAQRSEVPTDGQIEEVPEARGQVAGAGTHEFFGMTGGSVADEVAPELPTQDVYVEVPVTRDMAVVTGTLRSFGSDAIQALPPITGSGAAIHVSSPSQPEAPIPFGGSHPGLPITGGPEEPTDPFVGGRPHLGHQTLDVPAHDSLGGVDAHRPIPPANTGGGIVEAPTEQFDDMAAVRTDTAPAVSRVSRGPHAGDRSQFPFVLAAAGGFVILVIAVLSMLIIRQVASPQIEEPTAEARTETRAEPNESGQATTFEDALAQSSGADRRTEDATTPGKTPDKSGAGEVRIGRAQPTPSNPAEPSPSAATERPGNNSPPTARAEPAAPASPTTTSQPAPDPNNSKAAPQAVVPAQQPKARATTAGPSRMIKLIARPRATVVVARDTSFTDIVLEASTDDTRRGITLPYGEYSIRFVCDSGEDCDELKKKSAKGTLRVGPDSSPSYKVNFYVLPPNRDSGQ